LHPSPQKIFALRMRIALFKTLQIVDDTRYLRSLARRSLSKLQAAELLQGRRPLVN
jgi:hypothetical protein